MSFNDALAFGRSIWTGYLGTYHSGRIMAGVKLESDFPLCPSISVTRVPMLHLVSSFSTANGVHNVSPRGSYKWISLELNRFDDKIMIARYCMNKGCSWSIVHVYIPKRCNGSERKRGIRFGWYDRNMEIGTDRSLQIIVSPSLHFFLLNFYSFPFTPISPPFRVFFSLSPERWIFNAALTIDLVEVPPSSNLNAYGEW